MLEGQSRLRSPLNKGTHTDKFFFLSIIGDVSRRSAYGEKAFVEIIES